MNTATETQSSIGPVARWTPIGEAAQDAVADSVREYAEASLAEGRNEDDAVNALGLDTLGLDDGGASLAAVIRAVYRRAA